VLRSGREAADMLRGQWEDICQEAPPRRAYERHSLVQTPLSEGGATSSTPRVPAIFPQTATTPTSESSLS
jgi:hypothetical protein